jgi:hypothetical protein
MAGWKEPYVALTDLARTRTDTARSRQAGGDRVGR